MHIRQHILIKCTVKNKQTCCVIKFCGIFDINSSQKSQKDPQKVPFFSQRSKFCLCSDFLRQVPSSKSRIAASAYFLTKFYSKSYSFVSFLTNSIQIFIHLSVFDKIQFKNLFILSFSTKFNSKFDSFVNFPTKFNSKFDSFVNFPKRFNSKIYSKF